MNSVLEADLGFENPPPEKAHNYWKLLLYCVFMCVLPYCHLHLVHYLATLCSCFGRLRKNTERLWLATILNFLLDYVVMIPMLYLSFTFYDYGLYILLGSLMILIFLFQTLTIVNNTVKPWDNERPVIIPLGAGRRKFIFFDYVVGMTFFATCASIQYVDTGFFPSALTKTQTDGIGLMDLGIGFILFTSGVTSRQARGIGNNVGLCRRLRDVVIIFAMCAGLGLFYAILNEFLDSGDRSHGKNLNVLLMLAMIMIVAASTPNVLAKYGQFLGLGIVVVYEVALMLGLKDYLNTPPTCTNIFTCNVVGLCQTLGLLGCYYIGIGFGQQLFAIDCDNSSPDKPVLLLHSLFLGGALIVFLLAHFAVDPCAPHLCNLAYIAYIVLALSFFSMLCFIFDRMLIKAYGNFILDGPSKTSRLIYFVVCDALTGILGICLEYQALPPYGRLLVAVGYSFFVHVLFTFFIVKGISLRFW